MGDEILTGKVKRGIVICMILITLSTPPVYAFDFSEFIENIRGAIGLQTKPKISVAVSAPETLNTELGDSATISLSVNNEKGSATISVTGTAYLEGQEVGKIIKSISMEKESSTEIVVYEIPPSYENVGEWRIVLEVKAENERGISSESVTKTLEVISPPEIHLKIDDVEKSYGLVRDSAEKISPKIIIENSGGKASFSVNFVIKKDGQVVETIPKTYVLKKGEKIEEAPYSIQLNTQENEGSWEFILEASADNIAGSDESSEKSSTEVTSSPVLTVTRKLDRDKMRRDENLKVTIEIENKGFKDALDVSFKDAFPSSFKVISGDNSFKGTVKESGKSTFSYVVSPPKKGDYTFPESTVYYNGPVVKNLKAKSNINTLKVFGIPDLVIKRSFSRSEIVRGESTTVTIELSNTGDGIAKSTSFSDQMPSGVSLTSGSASINEDIQPGGSKKITYTATVNKKGQYTFSSSTIVTFYDELDKKYQSTVPTEILTVYGIPELKVTREIDRDKMRRGENLKVTVFLENIGDADAITVKFTDTPPTVFSSVSGSKSWTRKIGEGQKETFSYTVKPSKKGDYTFPEVSVYYTGKLTKELSSKSNTNFVQVFGIPDLKITRSFSKDEILKGDSTTVTITIYNVGDGIAKSTSFSDIIPSSVYYSSGTQSISKVDIIPGATKTISYTVTTSIKGKFTFSSISASHLDELLDKWYQPKTNSIILTVYGIPKIEFVSPFGVSKGEVVGDTTTLYVTIKNSGDGIAKNVYFSYASLPSSFKHYSGSKSWSGTLNPGESKHVEYTVLNDGTGTYEVSAADCSYKDELGNPYSAKISPISITVIGSKLVGYGLEADFDDDWASERAPYLILCKREIDYMNSHTSHKPKWYYRIILNKGYKIGLIQYFAVWPDQYDWPHDHPHDYEPIFSYFEWSGSDWKNSVIKGAIYSTAHSNARIVDEYLPLYGNHIKFRLKSGHHAYDGYPFVSTSDCYGSFTDFTVYKLTDNSVDTWNGRTNPFYYNGDQGCISKSIFYNPVDNIGACFKGYGNCEGYWGLLKQAVSDDGTEDLTYLIFKGWCGIFNCIY